MNRKITIGVSLLLLITGCANQPKKELVKKPIPKNMSGTTTTTTTHEGTVYASQKNYYINSCLNGNGQGCRDISTLYELGLAVPKNMKKALYYVEKGCELGNGSSCSRAGNFYSNGYTGVVDKQKAVSYYMKGCTLDFGTACNNLGSAYMNGRGVVKNLELSETYLKKALQLNYNAYNNLAFLYEMKGEDVKAEQNYIRGCNLDDSIACDNLGSFYKSKKDYTKAYNSYIKACNLSNARGCNSASMMIYKKLMSVTNANATMFKLDSNSCEMNNKIGCSNLAYDYKKGIGVNINIKKANQYNTKACKLGNKRSCKK